MAAKPATKSKAPATVAAPLPAKAAPKAAVPAKAAKPETIALKAVFEQLAEGHELSKKQAHSLLAGMVETVTQHLREGSRIRMAGLGILEVRDRPERMGINPATGASIKIAASRKVAFRVAKELKGAV